jgi:hypothetical protein
MSSAKNEQGVNVLCLLFLVAVEFGRTRADKASERKIEMARFF